jgi:CelD/BcsL family acetyltransferase involved in cellulose biosynthesis
MSAKTQPIPVPARPTPGCLITESLSQEMRVKRLNQVVTRSSVGGAAAAAILAESAPVAGWTSTESMDTYETDPLQDPRWEALVRCHPHASVFHSTNWLGALRHVYGYEPVVVTTCSAESPLTNGLVFARVNSRLTGRRLVSLPFSDHCEPLLENAAQLAPILARTKNRISEDNWKYMEIRPLLYSPPGSAALDRLVTYYFHSLDLRPGLEELFKGFHKDCVQRKIRRAEREKLRYEEGRSEELLKKFYRLLVMTRRRQYLPPQPIAWFRGLIASFGEGIKIRVASKDGVPVAGILTLLHRKSMVYKYGCSDLAYNNLGGTALLFWKTIQEAKERGFEELELGRSDTSNCGLVAFKERWGAPRREISYWTYPGNHVPELSSWQRRVARHIIPLMPDGALEAVGRLLYKHIG